MKKILITLLLFIGCGNGNSNSNENPSTFRSVDLTRDDAIFSVLDKSNITYLENVLKTASQKNY